MRELGTFSRACPACISGFRLSSSHCSGGGDISVNIELSLELIKNLEDASKASEQSERTGFEMRLKKRLQEDLKEKSAGPSIMADDKTVQP